MTLPTPPACVSLSSFGAAEVRRHGQRWFTQLCAEAGADGVEVRGELINEPGIELPSIAALARERSLAVVYSSPDGLWHADGRFDADALQRGLAAAQTLGAARLKMSIGGCPASGRNGDNVLQALVQRLEGQPVELLIENDQTASAGSLPALRAFFTAMKAAGRPLAMTFDMGNWHWTGEDPLQAATALASNVGYVHCKGVQRQPRQWVAVPLTESAAPWRAVLRALPAAAPRAIEYPLQGDDLLALTRRQLDLIRHTEIAR